MTGTPIPAGVLTVDDEPNVWGRFYVLDLNGWCVSEVTDKQRARLLSGPPRPDGVPDDAVPETIWYGPEDEDGRCAVWLGNGEYDGNEKAKHVRQRGVPVPPYQPDPDPEALLVEKITADWAHPDPADSATDHVEHYRTCNCLADSAECCRSSCACHAIPVAGERTGPLGLNEQEVRFWAGRDAVYAGPWAEGARALQAVCRAAVAEWDAQPEPAETLADIADDSARVILHQFSEWIDSEADRVSGEATHDDLIDMFFMERSEAARPHLVDPDPGTITVNLPADVHRRFAHACYTPRDVDAVVLAANGRPQKDVALAAAGLPQEPTEPEAQR